jgi:hypothetical protein
LEALNSTNRMDPWDIITYRRFQNGLAMAVDLALALQLQFSLEVRSLCFGLVSASPERPCDDASGLDAALRELEGDTTDFLDRPADQERRLIDRRGNVFLGPTTAALAR